jgi:hypothetical protein
MGETPGWQTDPTGRHQERYFDSAGAPTGLVRNDGLESTDEDQGASGIAPFGQASPEAETKPIAQSWTALSTVRPDTDPTLISAHTAPVTAGGTLQLRGPSEAVTLPSPPQIVTIRRRRNWWLISAACVLAVLMIVASVIAVQQHNVANKWMNDYNAEVHDYHAEVHDYQTEVHKNTALYATLVSTQNQLSAVSNQKEKALDQNAVLTTAAQEAETVTSELNGCVNDMNTVANDLVDVAEGTYFPSFSTDGTVAQQSCAKAQTDNQTLSGFLQQALSAG